jgi:subtilisin family serine protease
VSTANHSNPSRPARLELASGDRTVRVGIIDSGVHTEHPHVGNICGGVAITATGRDPCFVDRLGHGTAVAALIHQRAPNAQLFAVKVFHQSLATHLATILTAIDWCVDQGMDLINLSLGTTNQDHRAAFGSAAARGRARGTVIVSAAEMQGLPALPGSLSDVLGVLADASMSAGEFGTQVRGGKTVYTANPFAREIPGVPRERNLHGISFAVAHMTATLANLWNPASSENDPDSLLGAPRAKAAAQA